MCLGQVNNVAATQYGTFINTNNGWFSTGYGKNGELSVNITKMIFKFMPVLYPAGIVPDTIVSNGYQHSFLVSKNDMEEEEVKEKEEQQKPTNKLSTAAIIGIIVDILLIISLIVLFITLKIQTTRI